MPGRQKEWDGINEGHRGYRRWDGVVKKLGCEGRAIRIRDKAEMKNIKRSENAGYSTTVGLPVQGRHMWLLMGRSPTENATSGSWSTRSDSKKR
jgi:hypothetical protein